ncbi:MAG: hypothetical protein ACXVZ1_03640 [Gaiellaceae bacterium]
MEPLVHFWCPDDVAGSASDWDPDAEPQAFASGVGHGLLELFVRLRDDGMPVELGEAASRPPQLVVTSAGLLWRSSENAGAVLEAIAAARDRYVLIRGDVPLWWHLPVRPTVELMPSRLMVRAPNQRWLPPLPQRGLVRRAGKRIEAVRTVAIKCNPENLPTELEDPSFRRALEEAGIHLWIDMPRQTDGSDQRWHDFSGVDAVLCARPGSARQQLRKPATRLINSWVAGCIPIVTREPAYVELARDREDAWFLDSVGDLPSLVRRLNGSGDSLRRLEAGVRARQSEFEPRRILALWADLLRTLAATAPSTGGPFVRSRRSRAAIALWRLRAFHHGARIRNRTRTLRDLPVLAADRGRGPAAPRRAVGSVTDSAE